MLQDVRNSAALFGGLPLIASGDFAQILPVVRRGKRPQVVGACLQQSSLIWPHLTILHLRQNMRVLSGEDNTCFAAWTRSLATEEAVGSVNIPPWVTVFYSLPEFLAHVYPSSCLSADFTDTQAFAGRVVLSVRNDNVATINKTMLAAFPGTVTELLSVDNAEVEDSSHQDLPPPELLQSFEPPSLPPSKLLLKIGVPIILLQNVYPKFGLCNGT